MEYVRCHKLDGRKFAVGGRTLVRPPPPHVRPWNELRGREGVSGLQGLKHGGIEIVIEMVNLQIVHRLYNNNI